ncbi:MAG: 30S ribosomal protein S11 [bacterium]|nr:30S ribosomal protein S11 [bacterium]
MGKKRIIAKAEGEGGDEAEKGPSPEAVSQKSKKEHIRKGIAHIQATYNNTMILITDERGNAIAWSSAGSLGFKGTKKATPYAAARAAEVVTEKAKRVGMEEIIVMVKGIGSGRESAIRSLANHGLEISFIKDVTPIPHNGPRPKKVRRV